MNKGERYVFEDFFVFLWFKYVGMTISPKLKASIKANASRAFWVCPKDETEDEK